MQQEKETKERTQKEETPTQNSEDPNSQQQHHFLKQNEELLKFLRSFQS
jgi:hypothetical protein